MAADVVIGIREAIQDLPAPELRAKMLREHPAPGGCEERDTANEGRLRDGMRELKSELREWRGNKDRRFEPMEQRLDTYEDVEILKQQTAEFRARQQPSA